MDIAQLAQMLLLAVIGVAAGMLLVISSIIATRAARIRQVAELVREREAERKRRAR